MNYVKIKEMIKWRYQESIQPPWVIINSERVSSLSRTLAPSFSGDFLSKNIFRRILAMRSLNKNDTSELISTPYGLERYPNVSLHNGMKSILKDFYLFHEIEKWKFHTYYKK